MSTESAVQNSFERLIHRNINTNDVDNNKAVSFSSSSLWANTWSTESVIFNYQIEAKKLEERNSFFF